MKLLDGAPVPQEEEKMDLPRAKKMFVIKDE